MFYLLTYLLTFHCDSRSPVQVVYLLILHLFDEVHSCCYQLCVDVARNVVNLCVQLKSVAHLPWRAFTYKVFVLSA